MKPAKLTEKQRKFVEAYMGAADGNATQAARLAGYKGNDVTLGAVGNENIKKPLIAEAIAKRVEKCPLMMDRKERMELLANIAKGIEEDVSISFGKASKVPAGLKARITALDQLAKMSGDYRETLLIDGDFIPPVVINVVGGKE